MKTLTIVLLIAFFLAACGQKGPLRVAEPPAAEAPAAAETDGDDESERRRRTR